MQGATTSVETPLEPKRADSKPRVTMEQNRSRERMLELVKIRQEKAARGEVKLGRARKHFSREEKEADAIQKLWPKALKVLREQLEDDDPRVRQTAAIKVLEYVRGKPTQTVKQDLKVSAIRFETAAVGGMMLAPPPALELEEGEYTEDEDDVEVDQ